MKRNALTVVVGVIILLLFFLLLFTFQVRQTDIAVLTTFQKPGPPIEKPGLYFKWPRPIQTVYKFDKRVYSLEDDFEESLTGDAYPILANVYVGWTIKDPRKFFNSFPTGTARSAEPSLKSSVRSSKQAVIGQHLFADFISTNQAQMKFPVIENEILALVKPLALEKYGIEVRFLGIKRIGLPENVTQKVFDRMQAERQREIDRLKALGDAEAMNIRSAAERDREQILAKARAEATAIQGQAEAEATKAFDVFNQNQDLAIFLLQLRALEQTLKERATLVVDYNTVPFNMLRSESAVPAQGSPQKAQQEQSSQLRQPPVSGNN